MYSFFLNFPKVASYPAYQNSMIRKNFTVPFVNYKRLKLISVKALASTSTWIGHHFGCFCITSQNCPIIQLTNQNFAAASDRRIEPVGVFIAGVLHNFSQGWIMLNKYAKISFCLTGYFMGCFTL